MTRPKGSTVAFIGLGIMGSPMAAHLVAAGHDVTGFDLSPASLDKLVADGGKAAASAQEAVSGAEVVITMLPNHPQVEAVIDEVAFDDGTLLIDMSTIRPSTSIEIARKLSNVRVLDAPVSGGQTGAVQASLSIMVGGNEADFAAARPFLEVVGKTIVHVGPHGAGQVVKAANQLMVGGIYALVAESIVLLEASGVDPKAGLDVLAGGLAANRILDLKRESMIAREFQPGFRIDLHHKDMGIALDAARAADVSLPVTNQIAALVAAARAQGYGSLDHSALLKVIENFAGRS
ncbi:NAD(P)-dependent oxidoreductase [Lentzea flaviverrucosa]|uniref:2-hydroxy-3-oxopropionate reductase n=1 Tax=Lentzea flaviverrucosa TaxID=200379 RepID=A0A1H9QXS4_9PSEU|nr:NAD(P)-binding domain-containing protein [Lentzea flaviverrucosa]RDI32812.1 2-hydroxy-3-oxopropionate reductase [Lentzea flaviverrucosa]SER65274.1 2-hydroxy-3-oxopropionate reductase [Lentzea flaviverrucosa]